jgi:hypothetical protein
MESTISVQFQINNQETPITIKYLLCMEDNVQTIKCMVDRSEHRNWLQLTRFELRSQFMDGLYVALFDESAQHKNMATTLFLDKAYRDIMHREKLPITEDYHI